MTETPQSRQAPHFVETMQRLVQDVEGMRAIASPSGRTLARRFHLRLEALATINVYPLPDRHRIVKQLRLALSDFYVHLERKKSIYGFDPVRALDLLAASVEAVSDGEFHQSIVELVARTRDRHLKFAGRTPFGLSAVLPFTIERCWESGNAIYVVTEIAEGFTPERLRVGARVTHWNGIAVERVIRLNANVFDGGNEAASLARSIEALTKRSLRLFGPPLEEWVDLRFHLQDGAYDERFTWQGLDVSLVPPTPSLGRNFTGFGGDLELLYLRHARRVQFAPQSFDAAPVPSAASGEPGVPRIIGKDPLDNFDYGSVSTEHGTFGYVRLYSFHADKPDDIVNSFISVLDQLPKQGLIIDMRGNVGGYIAAGERVLQLFTPERITPTRCQFRVTPATRAMVDAVDEFQPWRQSVAEAFATGEPYSQGYPIEGTDEDANRVGQRYFGPVVLISDALAFSTADVFAAGFMDHEIGRLICTDENMAAAGSNNWQWWAVRLYNPDLRLDARLKAAFDEGTLSPEVRDAFNREGASLSERATLSPGQRQYDGVFWTINDGALAHLVRHLPWMNDPLRVYLDQGRSGFAEMPEGVTLSVTMRRCLRVRKSEGRLEEDLGIKPDVVYHMTLRDVIEKNQDLINFAAEELSRSSTYDLNIQVTPTEGGHSLICRTLHLTFVEIFAGQRQLSGCPASDNAPIELSVPSGFGRVEVKGFNGDVVVARRLVDLPT